MPKKNHPTPLPPLAPFYTGCRGEGRGGVGWSNGVAGEVSYHCPTDDDAEAVGDSHHSDGGEGLLEGFVAGDFDFGFGIDDDVVHRRVQIDITEGGVGWSIRCLRWLLRGRR